MNAIQGLKSNKYFIGLVQVVVILIIFAIFAVNQPPHRRSHADCSVDPWRENDSWQIKSSTLPVKILWQTHDALAEGVRQFYSSAQGVLANENLFIFLHTSLECNQAYAIAIDAQTGTVAWIYDEKQSLIRDIYAVGENYVVTSVSTITMLSSNGAVIWTHNSREIDSRSFNMMYTDNNSIYFPTPANVYAFDRSTGDFKKLPLPTTQTIIGYWKDFILTQFSNNAVQLQSVTDDDKSQPLYTLSFGQDLIDSNKSISRYYPRVVRYDDILLLVFADRRLMAVDFLNGDVLWEYNNNITMPTVNNQTLTYIDVEGNINLVDVQSGENMGYIELESSNESDCQTDFDRLWITSNIDTIFVYNTCRSEIFAVNVELNDMDK